MHDTVKQAHQARANQAAARERAITEKRLAISVRTYVPQGARAEGAPLAAQAAAKFADEAADRLLAFEGLAASIESNERLSDDARKADRAEKGGELVRELEAEFEEAHEFIQGQVASVEQPTIPKPADDPASLQVAGEIRAHLKGLEDNHARRRFLSDRADDPQVASAVLNAPPWLSGLTEDDVTFFRGLVRRADPERAAWFDLVEASQDGARRALANARNLVAERARMREIKDGWAPL